LIEKDLLKELRFERDESEIVKEVLNMSEM